MRFLVDPTLNLEQGVYDIGIENPSGEASALSKAFAVVSRPVLTSAVPTPVCTAQYKNEITLTGQRFLTIDGALPTVTIDGVDFTPTSLGRRLRGGGRVGAHGPTLHHLEDRAELAHQEVREVFVRKHRIVYRIFEDAIHVLTVFEGHRLFPTDGNE